MPKYIIASNYFEYETDMCSELREADNPLDAIIADCMDRCKLKEHEACASLEVESFSVCVWLLHEHGDPVHLDWKQIEWPWNLVQNVKERIKALQAALTTAESLEVLTTIPGTNAGNLELEPVRVELADLEERRQHIDAAWNRRKEAPVSDNRQRVVDVDTPEGEHATTTG